ncbi:ABC transporter permease [Calorimonas adulescens]|uniref:ABC transporter permease n=1 Tax=Calorimonas adulescens TaxID=2606906 RepID=A0A5D8QFX1_9THEO|nr:ABC transporter permease [Calorimonas adulescens]TZE83600.1 ABC transporter permease [Calorimonas adulescens]
MSLKGYFRYIYAMIGVVAVWYVLSIIANLPIIPSPLNVFVNTYIIFKAKIAIHVMYSIYRIFMGLILSIAIGVPLGLAMGYIPRIDSVMSPVVYLLYPIPKIAFLPVVMLIFGLGELSKIIMIMLIVVFQIIVSSRDAVKGIPEETYYSLMALGAGRLGIFKEIVIPAAMPEILTSIRVGLGTAVSVLFFTETFGTKYGIGYFIMDSWMRVNYLDMYSGIMILGIIGLCLFLLIDIMEFLLCPWKQ